MYAFVVQLYNERMFICPNIIIICAVVVRFVVVMITFYAWLLSAFNACLEVLIVWCGLLLFDEIRDRSIDVIGVAKISKHPTISPHSQGDAQDNKQASQSIRNQECRPGRILAVCLKARRSHST